MASCHNGASSLVNASLNEVGLDDMDL
jgi:hypothetical protein